MTVFQQRQEYSMHFLTSSKLGNYRKLTSLFLSLALAIDCSIFTGASLAMGQDLLPNSRKIELSKISPSLQNLILPGMQNGKTFKGDGESQFMLIRDLHCQEEAQIKIAQGIELLNKKHGVKQALIEGAEGLVRTGLYSSFPDDKIRQQVASEFLKEGYLSGAEYAAIKMGKNADLTLYGVEDASLYIENFRAFRNTRKLYQSKLKSIKKIDEWLRTLKKEKYSKELLSLDSALEKTSNGKIDVESLINSIKSFEPSQELKALEEWEKVIKDSKAINPEKIQTSLSSLINHLRMQLVQEEMKEVIQWTLEYRLKKIKTSEYLARLKQKAGEATFNQEYPILESWRDLSQRQESLDIEQLIKSCQSKLQEQMIKLSKQENVEPLLNLDQHWKQIHHLIKLELSRSELEELKKNGFPTKAFGNDMTDLKDLIESAWQFYELAQKRDHVLTQNALRALKSPVISLQSPENKNTLELETGDRKQATILITGGFHTEAIQKQLEESNISYTTWTPIVSNNISQSLYEKIMMDERFDLDNIEFSQKRISTRHEKDPIRQMLATPASLAQCWQRFDRERQEVLEKFLSKMVEEELKHGGSFIAVLDRWLAKDDIEKFNDDETRFLRNIASRFEKVFSINKVDETNREEVEFAIGLAEQAFGKDSAFASLVKGLLVEKNRPTLLKKDPALNVIENPQTHIFELHKTLTEMINLYFNERDEFQSRFGSADVMLTLEEVLKRISIKYVEGIPALEDDLDEDDSLLDDDMEDVPARKDDEFQEVCCNFGITTIHLMFCVRSVLPKNQQEWALDRIKDLYRTPFENMPAVFKNEIGFLLWNPSRGLILWKNFLGAIRIDVTDGEATPRKYEGLIEIPIGTLIQMIETTLHSEAAPLSMQVYRTLEQVAIWHRGELTQSLFTALSSAYAREDLDPSIKAKIERIIDKISEVRPDLITGKGGTSVAEEGIDEEKDIHTALDANFKRGSVIAVTDVDLNSLDEKKIDELSAEKLIELFAKNVNNIPGDRFNYQNAVRKYWRYLLIDRGEGSQTNLMHVKNYLKILLVSRGPVKEFHRYIIPMGEESILDRVLVLDHAGKQAKTKKKGKNSREVKTVFLNEKALIAGEDLKEQLRVLIQHAKQDLEEGKHKWRGEEKKSIDELWDEAKKVKSSINKRFPNRGVRFIGMSSQKIAWMAIVAILGGSGISLDVVTANDLAAVAFLSYVIKRGVDREDSSALIMILLIKYVLGNPHSTDFSIRYAKRFLMERLSQYPSLLSSCLNKMRPFFLAEHSNSKALEDFCEILLDAAETQPDSRKEICIFFEEIVDKAPSPQAVLYALNAIEFIRKNFIALISKKTVGAVGSVFTRHKWGEKEKDIFREARQLLANLVMIDRDGIPSIALSAYKEVLRDSNLNPFACSELVMLVMILNVFLDSAAVDAIEQALKTLGEMLKEQDQTKWPENSLYSAAFLSIHALQLIALMRPDLKEEVVKALERILKDLSTPEVVRDDVRVALFVLDEEKISEKTVDDMLDSAERVLSIECDGLDLAVQAIDKITRESPGSLSSKTLTALTKLLHRSGLSENLAIYIQKTTERINKARPELSKEIPSAYLNEADDEKIDKALKRILDDASEKDFHFVQGKAEKGKTGKLKVNPEVEGKIKAALARLARIYPAITAYGVVVLRGMPYSGHFSPKRGGRLYIPTEILDIASSGDETFAVQIIEDHLEHEYLRSTGMTHDAVVKICNEKRPGIHEEVGRRYKNKVAQEKLQALLDIDLEQMKSGTDLSDVLKEKLEYVHKRKSDVEEITFEGIAQKMSENQKLIDTQGLDAIDTPLGCIDLRRLNDITQYQGEDAKIELAKDLEIAHLLGLIRIKGFRGRISLVSHPLRLLESPKIDITWSDTFWLRNELKKLAQAAPDGNYNGRPILEILRDDEGQIWFYEQVFGNNVAEMHLGMIYTALPKELKTRGKLLENWGVLPLNYSLVKKLKEEVGRLVEAGINGTYNGRPVLKIVADDEGQIWFYEQVFGDNLGKMNLGAIYSALPKELKAQGKLLENWGMLQLNHNLKEETLSQIKVEEHSQERPNKNRTAQEKSQVLLNINLDQMKSGTDLNKVLKERLGYDRKQTLDAKEITLEDIAQIMSEGGEVIDAQGLDMLETPIGRIDLRRLNDIKQYQDEDAQVELARDLEIAHWLGLLRIKEFRGRISLVSIPVRVLKGPKIDISWSNTFWLRHGLKKLNEGDVYKGENVSEIVKDDEGQIWFYEQVFGKDIEGMNLGSIYTALPKELKTRGKLLENWEVLPLNYSLVKKLREEAGRLVEAGINGTYGGRPVSEIIADDEGQIWLYGQVFGKDIEKMNLSNIYSTLPKELKIRGKLLENWGVLPLNYSLVKKLREEAGRLVEAGINGTYGGRPVSEIIADDEGQIWLYGQVFGKDIEKMNLSNIYSTLPKELKIRGKLLENWGVLPLNYSLVKKLREEAGRLVEAGINGTYGGKPVSEIIADDEGQIWFYEQVFGDNIGRMHLGTVYSVLPKELKAQGKLLGNWGKLQLNYSLVKKLREEAGRLVEAGINGTYGGKPVSEIIADDEGQIWFYEQIFGDNIERMHLGGIYTALPKDLKAQGKLLADWGILQLNYVLAKKLREEVGRLVEAGINGTYKGRPVAEIIANNEGQIWFYEQVFGKDIEEMNLSNIYSALPRKLKKTGELLQNWHGRATSPDHISPSRASGSIGLLPYGSISGDTGIKADVVLAQARSKPTITFTIAEAKNAISNDLKGRLGQFMRTETYRSLLNEETRTAFEGSAEKPTTMRVIKDQVEVAKNKDGASYGHYNETESDSTQLVGEKLLESFLEEDPATSTIKDPEILALWIQIEMARKIYEQNNEVPDPRSSWQVVKDLKIKPSLFEKLNNHVIHVKVKEDIRRFQEARGALDIADFIKWAIEESHASTNQNSEVAGVDIGSLQGKYLEEMQHQLATLLQDHEKAERTLQGLSQQQPNPIIKAEFQIPLKRSSKYYASTSSRNAKTTSRAIINEIQSDPATVKVYLKEHNITLLIDARTVDGIKLTDAQVGVLLETALAKLKPQDYGSLMGPLRGKTFVLGLLDQSENLFENYLADGLIGINPAVLADLPLEARNVALQTGIINELCYKVFSVAQEHRSVTDRLLIRNISLTQALLEEKPSEAVKIYVQALNQVVEPGLYLTELEKFVLEMSKPTTQAAIIIRHAYDDYYEKFKTVTRRAPERFEKREWHKSIEDGKERVRLYRNALDQIENELKSILGNETNSPDRWNEIKKQFTKDIDGRYDADLALTFFYSVQRRFFSKLGVSVEYSDDGVATYSAIKAERPYHLHEQWSTTQGLVEQILRKMSFKIPYQNLEEDSRLAAKLLDQDFAKLLPGQKIDSVEILRPVFFRNKGAYVIGRLRSGNKLIPLAFALLNGERGLTIDAVVTGLDNVSRIFSYTRSNFHVDTEGYRELVDFLESMLPIKGRAALYSSIGFIHSSKLELIKNLRAHIEGTGKRFERAEGIEGNVMKVFSVPDFPYVFKIIMDESIKKTFQGKQHVINQYQKVHEMDRVGRMLDAHLYQNLRFKKSLFPADYLQELLRTSPSSVAVEGEDVILKHVYAQRRMTPLNVYLEKMKENPDELKRILIDFGVCIKDLAAAGMFVADILPKNFGVTHYGRVVLYDFDDVEDVLGLQFGYKRDLSPVSNALSLDKLFDDMEQIQREEEEKGEVLTKAREIFIRDVLKALEHKSSRIIQLADFDAAKAELRRLWSIVSQDEMASESDDGIPNFYVPDDMILLDEIEYFMQLREPLWTIFKSVHSDLFTVAFWDEVKKRLARNEVLDVFPYELDRRLHMPQVKAASELIPFDRPRIEAFEHPAPDPISWAA